MTDKEYVKDEEGQPGETSFKTKKGSHEILYSELYKSSTNDKEEKIFFSLTPEDSVYGGSFEVKKGTTWNMFLTAKFHGVTGNPWCSYNRVAEEGKWEGGEVVVKVIGEYVTGQPEWKILEDSNGKFVGKNDEILSRRICFK